MRKLDSKSYGHFAPAGTPPDASAQDERVLAGYGYRQELKREMGFFSSFALSFSIISVTTGIFAVYGSGLNTAGPAFIWTWLVVGAGQLLVALVFATLAKKTPLSGYAYQWTRELAGPEMGWWAGWMVIVQFMSGMPAVCYALANYLISFTGVPGTNRNLIFTTAAILVSIALINHFGIRLASRVNDFAVGAEILGTVVAGVVLLVIALVRKTNPAHFLFTHPGQPGGKAFLGALAFSSLMSIWTLTGFEGAANLAEETQAPQKHVPVAIVSSLLISVLLGFLVLAGFTLAIPSLAEAKQQPAPLLYIMQAHFPSFLITGVMSCVFLAIYASALANLTSLTRMVWAMARDSQLPQSRWLGRINTRRVPANAIWIVTAIAIVFTCWAKVETVMTSISAQAGYITYAIVVGAAVWGQAKRPRGDEAKAVGISKALAAGALGWLLLVIVLLSLPQAGAGWMGAVAMLGTGTVGLIFFLRRQKQKGSIRAL
jgi:amino acid transporter